MSGGADEARTVERLLHSLMRREIDRREFLALASTVSAGAILAACGGTAGKSTSKKTIPLYTDENDSGTLAFLAAAKKAFETEHPDTVVDIHVFSDTSLPGFFETAFREHTDMGIFTVPTQYVPGWANAGYLYPVDSVVSSVGASDFIDGTRMQIGGHDWWMPFQKSASVLWYRTDVLSAAGISSPPSTYEELDATLNEVHGRNGITGLGITVNVVGVYGLWALSPFVNQQGWDFFSPYGEITFNKPECFTAVQRAIHLIRSYSTPSFYNASTEAVNNSFVGGQLAFCWWTGRTGNLVASDAPKIAEVTDVLGPMPVGPFMQGQLSFGFGKGYLVSKNVKNPSETLAFLEYITTGQQAVDYALTLPGQPLPALNSVSAEFTNPNNASIKANSYMSNDKYRGWVSKMVAAVPYTVNETTEMGTVQNFQFKQSANVCPFASQIWKPNGYLGTMLQSILINNEDEQQAWTTAYTGMSSSAKAWLQENPSWKPIL
jgi:ABC-type glycerol-3-phosphate transport system substrate-binding protein